MISLQQLLLVIKAVVKLYSCIVSSSVHNAAEWREFVWAWSMSCFPNDMVERSARSCGKLGLEFKIYEIEPFVFLAELSCERFHSHYLTFFTCILALVSRARVVPHLINHGNANKVHLDFGESEGEKRTKKARERAEKMPVSALAVSHVCLCSFLFEPPQTGVP